MLARVRTFIGSPLTGRLFLGRLFAGQKARMGPGKPKPRDHTPTIDSKSVIEDIRSNIPKKMQVFEKSISLEKEQIIPIEVNSYPDVETITIKGKTYIPHAITAEELEMKKFVQKKKGVVLILRKIRALEDSSKIYEALRDEQKEDIYHAINSPVFAKMAPQHILRALIYAQKTRLVKVFESKSLNQAILKVATYLKKLSPIDIAAFAGFLSKARLTEEVITFLGETL